MTKYHEILRLTALRLSQRNIIQSIGVSQNTIVKVQRRAQELHLSWTLDEALTDAALEKLMFPKEAKVSLQKRMPDFYYIQKELLRNGVNKNSSGRNIWRNAAKPVTIPSCILSSAITSSRMSRNDGQPCTSAGNPVNRLKSTGLVTLHRSLIQTPARLSRHGCS